MIVVSRTRHLLILALHWARPGRGSVLFLERLLLRGLLNLIRTILQLDHVFKILVVNIKLSMVHVWQVLLLSSKDLRRFDDVELADFWALELGLVIAARKVVRGRSWDSVFEKHGFSIRGQIGCLTLGDLFSSAFNSQT